MMVASSLQCAPQPTCLRHCNAHLQVLLFFFPSAYTPIPIRKRSILRRPRLGRVESFHSLYCPQDRGCGHVPNALRANRGTTLLSRLNKPGRPFSHLYRDILSILSPGQGTGACGGAGAAAGAPTLEVGALDCMNPPLLIGAPDSNRQLSLVYHRLPLDTDKPQEIQITSRSEVDIHAFLIQLRSNVHRRTASSQDIMSELM
jgi:hypothetical protein